MKLTKSRSGFAATELILVLVLAAVVGFAGYYVYSQRANNDSVVENTSSSSSNSQTIEPDVALVPIVNTTEDLDKTLKLLDKTDLSSGNSSDTSQLDAQASNF